MRHYDGLNIGWMRSPRNELPGSFLCLKFQVIMRKSKLLQCCLSVASVVALPAQAQQDAPLAAPAPDVISIAIIKGSFGRPGSRRHIDIASRVQELCGTGAQSCQLFCVDALPAKPRGGSRAICRVTFSCGPALVRSVEAERDDPILMRCPDPMPEEVPTSATKS